MSEAISALKASVTDFYDSCDSCYVLLNSCYRINYLLTIRKYLWKTYGNTEGITVFKYIKNWVFGYVYNKFGLLNYVRLPVKKLTHE
jgi:hypothetical protein